MLSHRRALSSLASQASTIAKTRLCRFPRYLRGCDKDGNLHPESGFSMDKKWSSSRANALYEPPEPTDSFLQGNTASYVDEMYSLWKESPTSVHASWQVYFRNMENRQMPAAEAFQPPPGLISSWERSGTTPSHGPNYAGEASSLAKVQELVAAYRSQGHYRAKTDPLGIKLNAQDLALNYPSSGGLVTDELKLAQSRFSPEDMNQEFPLGPKILPKFITGQRKTMSLRNIIAACEAIYCGSYGVEYMHISDPAKRQWLRDRLEVPKPINFSLKEKRRILDGLILASSFEHFLASKFPNEKRYGLDGAETLAPGVTSLIDRSSDLHGVEDIVVGSCHRGRLTMMNTVYGKPAGTIFAEFAGRVRSDLLQGMAGDVRSHFGHDGQRITAGGRLVSISLLANPSHLEAVDPVSAGMTRATQQLKADSEKKKTMCLQLHGDAAFTGQGIVYETLGLSRLPAYDVGGTIHLIVNNQIGFTTDAHNSRSTVYASDIAKFIDAPILHVNGDDVEAVVFACQLAADWRATFHTDCVVDIICYRKYGHNEIDQPSFTQPLMYQKVNTQIPSLEWYIEQLVSEGSVSRSETEKQKDLIHSHLEQIYESSKKVVSARETFPSAWQGLPSPDRIANEVLSQTSTAVDESTLVTIGNKAISVPGDFSLHPNLQRVLSGRAKTFNESNTVDWSMAEALAFGSLCLEGNSVRIAGQDVQRGTFSQRHAVLHDQVSGKTWTPLANLSEKQGEFAAYNSPLNEFGALGFEYGVSLADPQSLVMWEAQFGDFANTAQVIIDNFISGGESKWLDRSGLVMSLPHGYDGQGAEHSSARLERFLMLCNGEGRAWPEENHLIRAHQDANIGVVYMTSPANYFHVLRRQLRREYRKPLVIFFSKSLLRHPLARSDIAEFSGSTAFQPVLSDPEHGNTIESPEAISRVIFCSGQVYATLKKHREAEGIRDVAITRIEELHPFPWAEVKANLDMYPNAKTIVWAQEEHYNGGAWHYMRDRLDAVLRKTENHRALRTVYAGRATSASTAAGIKSLHTIEEEQFLEDAFKVEEESA